MTHFDSEDKYRTGCRKVSYYLEQRSPGGSYSTYL